jgi:hypothetical protein
MDRGSCVMCGRQILASDFYAILSEKGNVPVISAHLMCLNTIALMHPVKAKKPKKYEMDESVSWEERYKALETHHIEETTYLLERLEETKAKCDRANEAYVSLEEEFSQFRWEHEDK